MPAGQVDGDQSHRDPGLEPGAALAELVDHEPGADGDREHAGVDPRQQIDRRDDREAPGVGFGARAGRVDAVLRRVGHQVAEDAENRRHRVGVLGEHDLPVPGHRAQRILQEPGEVEGRDGREAGGRRQPEQTLHRVAGRTELADEVVDHLGQHGAGGLGDGLG